jgi:hypothetical protein
MTLDEVLNCTDIIKIKDWFLTATARELQIFLHKYSLSPISREVLRVALDIRLSEDAEKTTNKLSQQTEKLIVFTNSLRWLTIVLVTLGVFQIVFQIVDYFCKSH